ncbi:hypothetical protein ACRTDU_11030 [Sunxiuqinia elliptica]
MGWINNNIYQIAMKNLFTFQLPPETGQFQSLWSTFQKQIWQPGLHAKNCRIVLKAIQIVQNLKERMKTVSVNSHWLSQLKTGIMMQCTNFNADLAIPESTLQLALYSPSTIQSGNPLIIKKGRYLSKPIFSKD